MTKIVLTFGLISGAIVAALMWLSLSLFKPHENFDYAMLVGYATMIIALSMIFFGIKSFRDNNGGKVDFLKGIQIGLLISLICAVCYGVSWEIYYQTSGGNFFEEYSAIIIEKMKKDGASADEIEKTSKEMASFGESYKNPVIRFAMTLMEILPVGVIVTLISAALLRRKEVLPASASQ